MMRKQRYIALLFISAFFLSLIFQAYHVISHQFIETNSSEHHRTECVASNTNSEENTQVQDHKDHFHCDICEYQFAFNDIPKTYISQTVYFNLIDIIISRTNNKSYQNIFNTYSSRAPPVEIFI